MSLDIARCPKCGQIVYMPGHTCYPYQAQLCAEDPDFIMVVDYCHHDNEQETRTTWAPTPAGAAQAFVEWLDTEYFGDHELSKADSLVKVVITDGDGVRHFFSVNAFMDPRYDSSPQVPTEDERDRLDAIRDEHLANWRESISRNPKERQS